MTIRHAREQKAAAAMSAQFPSQSISSPGANDGNDLVQPLQAILQGINLLGAVAAVPPQDGTSPGVAALEANATSLSKWTSTLVGGSAGLALIGTGIATFWNSIDENVRLAAVAGLSVALVAAIVGIAWIVSADLRARTRGQIAIYEARQAIAMQFMQEALSVSLPTNQPPPADAADELDEGSAPSPTTTESAVIGLAVAGKQAFVSHTPDGRLGNLSGIRTNGKAIEVGWLAKDSESRDWDLPSSFSIESYTYP
jgi:hypothetical protein